MPSMPASMRGGVVRSDVVADAAAVMTSAGNLAAKSGNSSH
jgi:hypothetical protein